MRRAAALWLVLFAAYAAGAGLPATPGEDLSPPEVHALLVAGSITSDGDIDLRDEFLTRAWQPFHDGDLAPRGGLTRVGLLDPVGIVFPLLIAPAYALGGAIAVQLLLAAVAAIAFVLTAALARRLVPEPWATGGALVVGLCPPAIVAATTIAPDAIAGSALAGAALLALRLRERPLMRYALPCALLLAVLPWLGAKFLAPTAVVAAAAARWLLRRRRGIAGLVAIEIVVFSAVLYVTVNDRLYGGPIPESVRAGSEPTGADTLGEHLARAPRLVGLWIDRDVGLLRWAPFAILALAALWLLARSRRERLASILSEQVDVEVTAGFLAVIGGATLLVAAFLAPTIAGPWFAGHELAGVLFVAGALGGWALRRFPRTGRALAAITLVASLWLLVAARVDGDAGLAPPRGPLPWLGAQDLLPNVR